MRHLLEVDDLTPSELDEVMGLARGIHPRPVLGGKGVALLFEKPSARTRNSMEMAVVGLGGHPITIRPDEVGIDQRETAEDIARTLGCYHAVIGARVFDHGVLERMAVVSPVPVVNMLSDAAHPLQALADLLTITDEFGDRDNLTVAYVGDANNVARSLALACGLAGMAVRVATPEGYGFTSQDVERIERTGAQLMVTTDPAQAVHGADVVYTDVWASMGQEAEAQAREASFAGYTVDDALMAAAGDDAIFMHCLPAHRGQEVSAPVVDGPRSRVWPQAENRMRAARGALHWLVTR
jgi:ornithine carbamoyltransferase